MSTCPTIASEGSEMYPMLFSFVLAGFAFLSFDFVVFHCSFPRTKYHDRICLFAFPWNCFNRWFYGAPTGTYSVHTYTNVCISVCLYIVYIQATAFELGFLGTLRTCRLHYYWYFMWAGSSLNCQILARESKLCVRFHINTNVAGAVYKVVPFKFRVRFEWFKTTNWDTEELFNF